MKLFLITLLLTGIGTGLFGQIENLSLEEPVESIDDHAGNFLIHAKYVGLGASHTMLRDQLAGTINYSGLRWGLSLLEYEIWYKKMHFSFAAGDLYFSKLKPRFPENVLSNSAFKYNLGYVEATLLKLNGEVRIKNSPHYLGGMFYFNLLLLESSRKLEDQYDVFVSDSVLPLGISYLYENKVLGIPVNVNFTLPLVHYRSNDYRNTSDSVTNYFGTITDYFSPTVKVTLYAPKKDASDRWEIAYVWNYTNINRTPSSPSYRHRRLTNGLTLTMGIKQ